MIKYQNFFHNRLKLKFCWNFLTTILLKLSLFCVLYKLPPEDVKLNSLAIHSFRRLFCNFPPYLRILRQASLLHGFINKFSPITVKSLVQMIFNIKPHTLSQPHSAIKSQLKGVKSGADFISIVPARHQLLTTVLHILAV